MASNIKNQPSKIIPAALIAAAVLAVGYLVWYVVGHSGSGLTEDRVTLPPGVHVGAPQAAPAGAKPR